MDPVPVAIGRIGLALLFAVAARHKLGDLRGFAATVEGYRILPPALAQPLAWLLPGTEIALAAALMLPATAAHAALAAALLLALYSAAIATNLVRGRRDIDCGCLGPGHRQFLSGWLLVRNGVLLAGAALAALPPAPRPLSLVDAVTTAGAILALVLLFSAANRLGTGLGTGLGAGLGNGRDSRLGAGARAARNLGSS